jgi:hypothetical protein
MAGGDHLFWRMKPVTGPERELLFCVASATEWERTDIMEAAVASMVDSGLLKPDASGRLDLTRQGHQMLQLVLGGEYHYEDIGGGLINWTQDWTNAHWNIWIRGNTIPHWNISIPGVWERETTLAEAGTILHHCGSRSGVYLLIGLDGAGKQASRSRH